MLYLDHRLLVLIVLVSSAVSVNGCDVGSFNRPQHWAKPLYNWHFRNAYQVSDELYRSAQPGLAAYREFHKLGVKISLDLRTHAFDATKLRDIGIQQAHIPMTAGSMTVDQIVAALKVINNSQAPVLVHCQQGADRTGAVVSFYRIVFQGWSKAQAIDEMVNGGYGFHSRYDNIITLIQNADIEAVKRQLDANTRDDKVSVDHVHIKPPPGNRING